MKKVIIIFGFVVFLLFAGFIGSFNVAQADSCPNSTASLDADSRFSYNIVIDSGQTTASVVVHNSSNCTIPMSLVSWKVYNNDLGDQSIYDTTTANVGPGNTTLRVDLASCMTQVDLYYGNERGQETDYVMYNGPACSHTIPTLVASCSVSPSNVTVGGYLNWSATASGGTDSYIYSWTGTDGLDGSSSYISKSYNTSGTKTGAVTVTSGSQSITRTCSAVVNTVPVDEDLTVSCRADHTSLDIDEDVTWRAYASGGNGSYSYDWSGTDGLDGSSRYIDWSYDDKGVKRAYITVTSGGQSASASCNVRVEEDEDGDDLSVSCYASPNNPQVGSRMNWYTRVSGGDGDYDYDWSGTDGLNSSSRSPYKTYDNPGSKRATVTVTDGDGNEDTTTCYANVIQNSVLAFSQYNQTPFENAVYLSQVPYTGVADNLKLYFFLGVLALFSAWISYIIIERKKEVGDLN